MDGYAEKDGEYTWIEDEKMFSNHALDLKKGVSHKQKS